MAGAFADSKGRYGYRRIKAVLKTGVSEKSVRRIMAEEGLVAHVPKRRRYGSYEGETTPAPANLVDRDFTAERPNEKWLTDISEIKARDGKGVPLAAGRLLRWQDRRIHRRLQPQRGAGQPDAGESGLDAAGERASPGAFRPWMPLPVARMARAHGTLREGFFGRMKTEAVYPEKWEEHTRNEVLALVDEYIRWHDHERIKQSLGWMSPVQYRQSQGMAA